jgi:uncharacterized protein YdhG (YjbR/CyaY superfamily)
VIGHRAVVSRSRKKVAVTQRLASVDEYIASFPVEVQERLQQVRRAIHDAVPGVGERISYQIPCITMHGRDLVYFSGWKQHIGVYPVIDLDDPQLMAELAPYSSAKATLKFPHKAPLPVDLIQRFAAAKAARAG